MKVLKASKIFVPYRGIYFLYKMHGLPLWRKKNIFVPYRGIYFLYVVFSYTAMIFG